MTPIAIVSVAAESALGSGSAAFSVGPAGARAKSAIRRDVALEKAGLKKPFAARAFECHIDERDPAEVLLERVARTLVAQLDDCLISWRSRRIGVVVGTSSGGMDSLVRALAERAEGRAVGAGLARRCPYFGPLTALDRLLGVRPRERVQVLAACASSTMAVGLACRWLELGRVDLVIAGGYDAVTTFVAAGFEAIGATAAGLPAPFRVGREGMALGEGAALVALARAGELPAGPFGYVNGFGASCDASHITAPEREGNGLANAARAALDDASLDGTSVELVSAHATATRYNDAAEAKALATVLGERAAEVVVHPFKAVIGHTLGASGLLEGLAALEAMQRGILPAALGTEPVDPETPVRLLERNEVGSAATCLKLSAAFGGANAALVLGGQPGAGSSVRPSAVTTMAVGGYVDSLDVDAVLPLTRMERQQLARIDPLSALVVAATARVVRRLTEPLPVRTAVVVGSATATIENNERFDQRLRELGARGAEPRRFPPTSPNLSSGQCAIAFGLRGPILTVGAGLAAASEALLVGHDLVAAGDADAAVVVAAEHVGHVVREFWGAVGWPVPSHGAVAVVLRPTQERGLDRNAILLEHQRIEAASGVAGRERPGYNGLLAALAAGTS